MKVHLVRDYSVPLVILNETIELLNKIKGPIQYLQYETSVTSFLSHRHFGSAYVRNAELYKKEIYKPDRFFKTCDIARDDFNIPSNEIVIILTAFRSDNDWFSMFKDKNAYIFVRDWDLLIDAKETFSIAFQIVENIFQLLSFGTIENTIKHLHHKSIACINDFCEEIYDVIYKLRSGYICQICLNHALENNVHPEVLKQIISTLHLIRDSISNYNEFLNQPRQYNIKITDNYDLIIDELNATIKLNPGEKTLYFFFLEHKDGVEFNYLQDYSKEIFELYNKFSKARNLSSIRKSAEKLSDPRENAFNEKLSRIKSKFLKVMPLEQARHYIPLRKSNNRKYMISISRNQFHHHN